MNRPPSADITRLVAEHQAAVFRAAFRLAGQQADAEDLTQQTFLAAQRSLAQLRDERAALGWLLAILRSCFLKSCRKRQPLSAETCDLDLNKVPAAVPEADDVDPEKLQSALNELPPEGRVMVTMFYFENRTYREIAEALGVPLGTVMSRLSRAKEHLRRRLTASTKSDGLPPETNR